MTYKSTVSGAVLSNMWRGWACLARVRLYAAFPRSGGWLQVLSMQCCGSPVGPPEPSGELCMSAACCVAQLACTGDRTGHGGGCEMLVLAYGHAMGPLRSVKRSGAHGEAAVDEEGDEGGCSRCLDEIDEDGGEDWRDGAQHVDGSRAQGLRRYQQLLKRSAQQRRCLGNSASVHASLAQAHHRHTHGIGQRQSLSSCLLQAGSP